MKMLSPRDSYNDLIVLYHFFMSRSKKSGFSADFLGFSSSVSHESVSSYFSNMCFGLASEYDQHNYYSLKLNWKHRGLTSG